MKCPLVVTVALLLASCTGASASSGTAASRSSPARSSSSGTSVSQVASLVAQNQAGLEQLKADLTQNCDAEPLACGLTVLRAPDQARLLVLQLQQIRHVPAEIKALVERTIKDAKTLSKENVRACAKDAQSADCSVIAITVAGDVDNLLQTLAGWEPYQ